MSATARNGTTLTAGDSELSDESLLKEYYAILEIVNEFDKRLLTVKGWGVTLSLAAIGWGFQYGHYGLFLVAAISGLGFWIIEGVLKGHQIRYYVRMREIEVLRYESAENGGASDRSSPRVDWAWSKARDVFKGTLSEPIPRPSYYEKRTLYEFIFLLPHVFLPHAVSFVAGAVLLALGANGLLGLTSW